MFTRKPKEPTPLDEVIADLHQKLSVMHPITEEYSTIADQLVKLYKLRKETESLNRPSADTLALIGANLLGILIIIGHERAHVITTKALSFLARLK